MNIGVCCTNALMIFLICLLVIKIIFCHSFLTKTTRIAICFEINSPTSSKELCFFWRTERVILSVWSFYFKKAIFFFFEQSMWWDYVGLFASPAWPLQHGNHSLCRLICEMCAFPYRFKEKLYFLDYLSQCADPWLSEVLDQEGEEGIILKS